MKKLPHLALYSGDWLKDPVARCSLEAQGLWLRLLFVMQESPRRGFLCEFDECTGSVRAVDERSMASACGVHSVRKFQRIFNELLKRGVPSKDKDGVYYSRRMVRDEALREIRAQSGALGGKAKFANSLLDDETIAKHIANSDNDNDNGTAKYELRVSTGTGGRINGIPESVEQVIAYGATLHPKVNEARCRSFWSYYEGQARMSPNGETFWVTRSGTVISRWKEKLPTFAPETDEPRNGRSIKPSTRKPDHSKGF